jgi:hypothetical protein
MSEWPGRLRFAVAAALGVETLLTLAAGIYLTHGLLTDDATEFDAAVWMTVLVWALALSLAVLARGVLGRRAWARGPVITLQLIALPVAWTMLTSEKWYLGALLLVAAVVGLTGLHPSVLGRAGGEEARASGSEVSTRRQ